MKKIIALIILIGIVLLAAITCPDAEAHKNAIVNVMSDTVDDKISEELNGDDGNIISNGLASIGSMFAGKIIDSVVDSKLHVENYVVFSLGKIHWEQEDKVVSVGVFNQIYTFSKEDIQKVLHEQGL